MPAWSVVVESKEMDLIRLEYDVGHFKSLVFDIVESFNLLYVLQRSWISRDTGKDSSRGIINIHTKSGRIIIKRRDMTLNRNKQMFICIGSH